MTEYTMMAYLLNNGWKAVSHNYLVRATETENARPMDVVLAYVAQRHAERVQQMQMESVAQ